MSRDLEADGVEYRQTPQSQDLTDLPALLSKWRALPRLARRGASVCEVIDD